MATRLSAPTMAVWLIALIVGAIGILNHLRVLHLRLGVEDFWLVAPEASVRSSSRTTAITYD